MNDDFPVFKFDAIEGTLGPGDIKYVVAQFRPMTIKNYEIKVPIQYTDDIHKERVEYITIKGQGYHPITDSIPEYISPYENIPKFRVHNYLDNKQLIQKCGVSLEVH